MQAAGVTTGKREGRRHGLQKTKLLAALAAITALSAAAATAVIAKNKKKKRRVATNMRFYAQDLIRPSRTHASTPWQKILTSGSDSSFLLTTSLTRTVVLDELLPAFEKHRALTSYGNPFRNGPKLRGSRPILETVDILAMALHCLKSPGYMYEGCTFFGMSPTSLSVWVDYGITVLKRVVTSPDLPACVIRWPTVEEMKLSANLLEWNRKHGRLLSGVFGVMDGGRVLCADFTDEDTQNAYLEGFTQNVEVTNRFVFNFFGELIHAVINFSGSWHDTRLALDTGLCDKYVYKTPPGMAILADSAFVNNPKKTFDRLVRGRTENEWNDIPTSDGLVAIGMLLQRAMPSERQSAEWGIRGVKQPCGRYKRALPADGARRHTLLTISSHLYNLRVRRIRRNQIRTVYQLKHK